MKDLYVFLSITTSMLLLFTAIFASGNWLAANSCARTAELYKLEYNYTFLTGCQFLFDGKWVGRGNYRAMEPVRR